MIPSELLDHVLNITFMITDVKDMASTIKKAFYVASTGRPGPVVVDIPKDITEDTCEFNYPESVS